MSISPSDASPQVSATYYDGQTTSGKTVGLTVDSGSLLLRGDQLEMRWPLPAVRISERLGNTPRLITHTGHGHCEVKDLAGLDRLLALAGARKHWLDGMQHSLLWALAAVVLIAASFAGSYRYLLPWGAAGLAKRMPPSVLQKMGSSTLDTMDRFMLKPSNLDAARQQGLSDAFARLIPQNDAQLEYRILFRSSPDMGANAFALPDGTIVLLDELVALTRDDNEIIAVLAHEHGHVEQRHALRMVLQSSAVGIFLAWYVGDVSSLLAAAPAIIMQAKYSRDMESEADEYAKRVLQLNGLSPCLLAGILTKLEAAHLEKEQARRPAQAGERTTSMPDYLSSHAATHERTALLCAPD